MEFRTFSAAPISVDCEIAIAKDGEIMDPLQASASSQNNVPTGGGEPHPGEVTAFGNTANLPEEPAANPWATTPTPAAPSAPAPQTLAVEQGGSAGSQLDAPGNAERRSTSVCSHPGAPMFAALTRDHQSVVPVLEGEVSGAGASEQIADDFRGNKHFERNGGQVRSTGNSGIITVSENSGDIALTRNRNALTVANNDAAVTSRQAQKGAVEHIETNSGLYQVSEQSSARHNIVNNRQTAQIGDRDGGGLGEDGLVHVSGDGKVEFWHPNAQEPEIHHLNGNTLTFTRRGLPNVLQRTVNWAANDPGKAGAIGAAAAGVGAAGTGWRLAQQRGSCRSFHRRRARARPGRSVECHQCGKRHRHHRVDQYRQGGGDTGCRGGQDCRPSHVVQVRSDRVGVIGRLIANAVRTQRKGNPASE